MGRGFTGPFKQHELPEPLKPSDLEPLVARLRQGDETVKPTIVGHHMRLAMSIVSKFAGRYYYLVDDLVGAAMVGICQAVDWAPTHLYDNNITPYIYQTCERHVRDLIEKRLAITIPRGVFCSLQDERNLFLPVVNFTTKLDDEGNEYEQMDEIAAKTVEEHPLLFEELLESLALSAKEKTVLQMLLEAYTQDEIAAVVGLTRQRVSQISKSIGARLCKL